MDVYFFKIWLYSFIFLKFDFIRLFFKIWLYSFIFLKFDFIRLFF